MFFLQMAGFPGAGKSTLARVIGKETGAVVIDHDIVKSALLESLETDIDARLAGKIAYNIEWSLLDFHLSQGQSVILDSPCFYEEMVEKGLALCEKHGAKYKYIECYLKVFEEANRRLKTRKKLISQIDGVASEKDYLVWIEGSKKPSHTSILTIDTRQPVESYLEKVLSYITDTISTKRCVLSPLQGSDYIDVMALYTNEQVRKYLGGTVDENTYKSKFERLMYPEDKSHYWTIRCNDTQEFIGMVYLDRYGDGISTELSYQLLPSWWGKGYATEILTKIIPYASDFWSLTSIVAETQTANIASCRLLERVGMRLVKKVERFGTEQAIYSISK